MTNNRTCDPLCGCHYQRPEKGENYCARQAGTIAPTVKGGWTQHVLTEMVPMHRTGWPGVWDAFVSAITRNPRLAIAKPVTHAVGGKGTAQVTGAQVEG